MKINTNKFEKEVRKGKYRILNKTENKISFGWYENEKDNEWHSFESMPIKQFFQTIQNKYESWEV